MTLHYDTRSRLLIRPYEKQQVDVRKAINQSANMAANRPAALPVFFFLSFCVCEEEPLVDKRSEQMHKMLCASHAHFTSTSFLCGVL